jgi:hypothetical protein
MYDNFQQSEWFIYGYLFVCYQNVGILMKVCGCMTVFNNKNGLFTLVYFDQNFRISVDFFTYVDMFEVCHGKKKLLL